MCVRTYKLPYTYCLYLAVVRTKIKITQQEMEILTVHRVVHTPAHTTHFFGTFSLIKYIRDCNMRGLKY